MNLSQIFVNERKWTQNAPARDKNGKLITFTAPWDHNTDKNYLRIIDSWSLYGAVAFFNGAESEVARRLKKAIERYTGKNLYIAEFNDSIDTSFEDVKKVIKIFNQLSK